MAHGMKMRPATATAGATSSRGGPPVKCPPMTNLAARRFLVAITLLLSACGSKAGGGGSGGASGGVGGANGDAGADTVAGCGPCAANQVCSNGACVDLPSTCPCPKESYCDLATGHCVIGCTGDDGCSA